MKYINSEISNFTSVKRCWARSTYRLL
jgi:hypothetical protein